VAAPVADNRRCLVVHVVLIRMRRVPGVLRQVQVTVGASRVQPANSPLTANPRHGVVLDPTNTSRLFELPSGTL